MPVHISQPTLFSEPRIIVGIHGIGPFTYWVMCDYFHNHLDVDENPQMFVSPEMKAANFDEVETGVEALIRSARRTCGWD